MKIRASSVSLRVNKLGYEAFTFSEAIPYYPFFTVQWQNRIRGELITAKRKHEIGWMGSCWQHGDACREGL
jgi:hypothetical protein